MSQLITYKIVSDEKGKVKKAARTACNFWNRFVSPKSSVVIRLGVFDEDSDTIAMAYEPHRRAGVVYGRVDFNAKYLARYDDLEIAGTVVHEIGHTLGFGWAKWMTLFDEETGKFKPRSTKAVPALESMLVETDGDEGTALAHWDEDTFDKELMTGYEDASEHVLPVTIAVMKLLGHRVKSTLPKKTSLRKLLRECSAITFKRKAEAKKLDLDLFRETPLLETVPHRRPRGRAGRGRRR
ncbi:MAG: hypothetical protein IPM35_10770 [Myxococcales bacterium]|nr:hypothetical protein [Myxococcales bacterium]